MSWAKWISGFSGASARLEHVFVSTKENEDLEDFKERIKKYKKFSEDFLFNELYQYINYSKELEKLVSCEKNKCKKFDNENYQLKIELEEMKQKLEKWKAMYTGQCEANKVLILRSENGTKEKNTGVNV